jgi:hypothetical protein
LWATACLCRRCRPSQRLARSGTVADSAPTFTQQQSPWSQSSEGLRAARSSNHHHHTGAGEDNGIDHNQNWLRFPYDSTFLRSHYLHPHPYALGGQRRQGGGRQVATHAYSRCHSGTPYRRGAVGSSSRSRSCSLSGQSPPCDMCVRQASRESSTVATTLRSPTPPPPNCISGLEERNSQPLSNVVPAAVPWATASQ